MVKKLPNTGAAVFRYDIIYTHTDGYKYTGESSKDPKGNLTTKYYDALGRLKLVASDPQAAQFTTYAYDANGNRTSIKYPNGVRNVQGLNAISRTIDGTTVYYLYNRHADVTALLNSSGTILASYYYDAFGNPLETTGTVNNPMRYAGYQYDSETGLYYLNSRMYDPNTARFMQEDTYRGDPNDPLSLNLYTYCSNEPIMYTDPTGHMRVGHEDLDRESGRGRIKATAIKNTQINRKVIVSKTNRKSNDDLDRSPAPVQKKNSNQVTNTSSKVSTNPIRSESNYVNIMNKAVAESVAGHEKELANTITNYMEKPEDMIDDIIGSVGGFVDSIADVLYDPAGNAERTYNTAKQIGQNISNDIKTFTNTSKEDKAAIAGDMIGDGIWTGTWVVAFSYADEGIVVKEGTAEVKAWRGTKVVNGMTVVDDVGAFGEHIAEDMLAENGWKDFTYIKSGSDNGIDIIARGPNGQLGFFEVKTSSTGKIPSLSSRQKNMNNFIEDVLSNAASGTGRYQKIDRVTRNAAQKIYDEFLSNPSNVSGNVIGVDLKSGTIKVSRWER